jgi:hypothetical protein
VQAHTHTVQPAHLAIGSVFNENFIYIYTYIMLMHSA